MSDGETSGGLEARVIAGAWADRGVICAFGTPCAEPGESAGAILDRIAPRSCGAMRRSKSRPPDLGFTKQLSKVGTSWNTGGMYQVEIYGRIRRAVLVEGRSQRSVARDFGLARVTVRKMLGYSIPPGYRRKEPPKRPKLGPWVGVIDTILEEDQRKPAKQRHTAQRIFDRLRAEHGFTGGYTIVKDYVRAAGLRHREMFIPLAHAAGTAQADFGEALVIVGGEERKAHYLAIDLPHSDDCFVMAFPAETTEAFLEGHVQAFAYFGGVPTSLLYDNTQLAVARILGDGTRQKTRAFSELQSHYLFADKFGRPAKGNDKGKVK